jgi:hypothetical protein
MEITRKEREELNRLSLKYFGTSSRWQKMVRDGYSIPTQNEDGSYNQQLRKMHRPSIEEILRDLKGLEDAEKAREAEEIKNDTIESVAQQATGVLDVEELSKRSL